MIFKAYKVFINQRQRLSFIFKVISVNFYIIISIDMLFISIINSFGETYDKTKQHILPIFSWHYFYCLLLFYI